MLDPIVSLSVAVAEGPGSYALLLGSGISADAEVPTGGDVFWTGVADLYRLTTQRSEEPDRDALHAWLKEIGGRAWTYSDILERLAEDPPARRDYLAKFFEGRTPGATHERSPPWPPMGLSACSSRQTSIGCWSTRSMRRASSR